MEENNCSCSRTQNHRREITHYIQTLPREQQVYATQPQFRDYCKEQIIALYVLAEEGKEEKLDESEEFLTQIEKAKQDILAQMVLAIS